MQAQKIEFQQVRDFGHVFNDGFLFVRQHFKRLFTHLLFIGGPFLLVGVGVSTAGLVRMQGLTAARANTSDIVFPWQDLAFSYLVNIFSFLIGFVMTTGVVNGYVELYKESPDREPDIQLGAVWAKVKSNFWRLSGQIFLVNLLLIAVTAAVVGLGFLVFSSNSGTGTKVVFGILYVLSLMLLFAYLAPYLGVVITQTYFERSVFPRNISRTFYLIKDNWWLTFGLGVVCVIVMYGILMVFYMPFYFIMMFNTLLNAKSGSFDMSSMVGVTVAMTIALTIGSLIIYIIHYVMAALHYHNLLERKESVGLLDKIQSLGMVQASSAGAADFYGEEEKY